MLTPEVIKANEALAKLDDNVISQIVELSKNDENEVIANKIGEVHGRYDLDIKEALGIEKPSGVKTYQFLKDQILPLAKQGSEAQAKIDAANQKVADLEKQIKENAGDKSLVKKLQDAEDRAAQLEQTYKAEKEELEKKYSAKEQEVTMFKIDAQFSRDTANVKWIDETILNKSIRNSILNQAKKDVLATATVEFDKDGNQVLRDKDGKLMLNKANGLKPYSLAELVLAQESVKQLIQETGKGGTGDDDDDGDGGDPTILDLSSAKTQVEAGRIIDQHLMKEGKARGTSEFTEAKDKLWKDNKVADLPTR